MFIESLVITNIIEVPPYGQDDNEDLKSVFEIPHLRHSAILLDTQCMFSYYKFDLKVDIFVLDRLPPHIGNVISKEVYDNKLFSNPDHPVKTSLSCFVHVEESCEKQDGTSWNVSIYIFS